MDAMSNEYKQAATQAHKDKGKKKKKKVKQLLTLRAMKVSKSRMTGRLYRDRMASYTRQTENNSANNTHERITASESLIALARTVATNELFKDSKILGMEASNQRVE